MRKMGGFAFDKAGLFQIEPNGDGTAMGGEPLGFSERQRRWTQIRQRVRIARQHSRPLDEIEHRKAGRKTRGARGWKHVVRTRDVIADDFRRMAAEKSRACVLDEI